MRAVIQRVSEAAVSINEKEVGRIGNGLVVLVGITAADDQSDIDWLTKKISLLRIFSDEKGHMNLCLTDIKGEALVISQFTLFAKTKKGNRPSFIHAAKPAVAIPLYENFKNSLSALINKPVESGVFWC